MQQVITLKQLDTEVIPFAVRLLGWSNARPEVRVALLAIAGQESGLTTRVQILDGGGRGPARGLLQFEKGGGVRGVMQHPATAGMCHTLCGARDVAFDETQIWMALERDDVLALGMGRLLLLCDPKPLPAVGDADGMWACYLKNWRPGKPHLVRWPPNYSAALRQIQGEKR